MMTLLDIGHQPKSFSN